jgi:D-3-phosphoglycerate dehydrogenase
MATYRIALTGDMQAPSGGSAYPMVDLTRLAAIPGVDISYIPVPADRIARAEDLSDVDALILCECGLGPQSFPGNGRLDHVARFGVGFDDIDLEAATRAGVLITNTPESLRRPMAVAALLLVLALANRLFDKSRLVHEGEAGWSRIAEYLGQGLQGRTLGSLGLGSIGGELFRLARPFGFELIAHDPFLDPQRATALGTRLVDLDTLCRRSDFLTINCPLNRSTEGLISAARIRSMKPSAYLINTARGRIVDQASLTAALAERRIAGAALDVFCLEPLPADDPLTRLDNVILTPHAIGLTDQCFADIGRTNVEAILALMQGRIPANVVNRPVLDNPLFQARLARLAETWFARIEALPGNLRP